MRPMVFVPATVDDLRTLRDGGALTAPAAYAANDALRTTFGFTPDDDEEAELAAQLLASLARAEVGTPRVVVAAEVDRLPDGVDDLGGLRPPVLPAADVRAVFIDDVDDLPSADALDAAADGDLSALDGHPMLWFASSELDHLIARLGG